MRDAFGYIGAMLQPSTLYLTPTPRLARKVKSQHGQAQSAAGLRAWHAPQVLTFSAWLAQLRDDYYLCNDADHVAISTDQALLIWQSIIAEEVFVNMPEIAALAQQAWRTIHEHALTAPAQWPELALNEDTRRFTQWAAAYNHKMHERRLLDEWAFYAQLPALIAGGDIELPQRIELTGFDLPPTPLQQNVLDAAAASGCVIEQTTRERNAGSVALLAFTTPDAELRGAARWARECHEANDKAKLAIVVPDLAGRVDRVERLLQQVLDAPGFTLQDSPIRPWHISLGKPLTQWPLVADALTLLGLNPKRISQPQLTTLLRCPLLPGWRTEASQRNRCLLTLARQAPYHITANELLFALQEHDAGDLSDLVERWLEQHQEAAARTTPSAWVQQLQQELKCWGFGAGRSLDSREYQVLQRWHQLLESMSALDLVSDPLDRSGALGLLGSRAANIIFRERDPGAAIEVLGVQEALGSRFDALWITTLDSSTWPGATQRNALIPASIQAEVPRATSDSVLARAQAELSALVNAAPRVTASYARGVEDIPLTATSLVTGAPFYAAETAAPIEPLPAPAPQAPVIEDDNAPALEPAALTAPGGTGLLSDQSACPFRAFAKHRLGAHEYRLPRPGLDPGQRGTLIHDALEAFWQDVDGSKALDALTESALNTRIEDAVDAALHKLTRRFRLALSQRSRTIEQLRCRRWLGAWLALEAQRPDFTVLKREAEVTIALGALVLNGKIDRIDAIDSGEQILIDYKTSSTPMTSNRWTPDPRISDPQLPAYALSMATTPGAIAFANIAPQVRRFNGLSKDVTGIQGVSAISKAGHGFKVFGEWEPLVEQWRTDLNQLASSYVNGSAAVDPRKKEDCKHCHLHSLCRINERSSHALYAESEAGDSSDE